MGKVIIATGGGGGVLSDDLTVTAPYVLEGKTYMGSDTDDEIGTGTMVNVASIDPAKSITMSNSTVYVRMTNGAHITNASSGYPEVSIAGSNFGDASTAYVYSGKTFTSASGLKLTGAMTVSSVLSFSVAAYSTTQLLCTWKNPAQASGRPFSGVIICCKTGSYPTSPTDGYKYMGSGGNSTAQGTGSATISGLTAGTTYYLRIWSYCVCSAGNYTVNSTKVLTNGYLSATCATTASGRKAFTSSGTWTVPSGVRTINIHAVGGGGAGHRGQALSAYYKSAGGGGGGGYSAYQTGISVVPGNVVTFTIGAGGTNTNPSGISTEKTGGDTTVTINNTTGTSITAEGGITEYSTTGMGGDGDGAGGHGADFEDFEDGSAGGNGKYEFGASSGTRYSGGGGGAGGSYYHSGSSTTFTFYGKSGGDRGGGKGADYNGSPSNGTAGTGGGGGGGYFPSGEGGTGGCGCVVITW